MLKKQTAEPPAEGSSPAMPACSSVMAAMIAQREDPRTVAVLVQNAMHAHGIAGGDDEAEIADAMGEMLRGSKC